MNIRPVEEKDWPRIIEISEQQDYPIPNVSDIVRMMVVEEEGKILAFGYLVRQIEAVLAVDKEEPNKVIASALRLLQETADEEARGMDFKQLHCFVWLEGFVDILKKHFGYRQCKGTALIKEL